MDFLDGRAQFVVLEDCLGLNTSSLDDRPSAHLARDPLDDIASRPIQTHLDTPREKSASLSYWNMNSGVPVAGANSSPGAPTGCSCSSNWRQ